MRVLGYSIRCIDGGQQPLETSSAGHSLGAEHSERNLASIKL